MTVVPETAVKEIVPMTAAEYAAIEDRLAVLLGTRQDVLVLQGEAVLPLEAAARGLGRDGLRALNIVTSEYGANFGDWLRQAGSDVTEVAIPFDRAVSADEIAAELERLGEIDVVSFVHGEAASGVLNPLPELAELARDAGALVVVDAVASFGADPVPIDELELDVVVISAQKSLSGPTGVSAVTLSERAWARIEANGSAPRRSLLSLLDWREHWLETDRSVLPVIPHHVEMRLLGVALEAAQAEGLDHVIARHRRAAAQSRAGLGAIGLEPFVADAARTAAIATTFRPPPGMIPAELLSHIELEPRWLVGVAPAAPDTALRINHMGLRATEADVERALAAIGAAIRTR
jgi:aspartate aminotransferase-like enzyme